MVRHVVLWTLLDTVDKNAVFSELQELFAGFTNDVPGLLRFELHRGYQGWDICLMSDHADAAALEEYQRFPAHLLAKEVVKSTRKDRASCDFEL